MKLVIQRVKYAKVEVDKKVVGEINKDTYVPESGVIELDYGEGITSIKIKITKPIKTGSIHLQNKKVIKDNMTNTECKETQEIINEEIKSIYENKINHIAEIKDASTSINFEMDKTELTNKVQNDVIITATLLADEVKYNLFKNPVILINFPSEVENIILGEVSLLYDENLSIKNQEVVENNGTKAIKIELDGTQNTYNSNSILKGPNIIIPATIIIKKDIQSTESKITATYTNESATSIDYQNEGKNGKEINVNIQSVIEDPEQNEEMISQLEENRIMTLAQEAQEAQETQEERGTRRK